MQNLFLHLNKFNRNAKRMATVGAVVVVFSNCSLSHPNVPIRINFLHLHNFANTSEQFGLLIFG